MSSMSKPIRGVHGGPVCDMTSQRSHMECSRAPNLSDAWGFMAADSGKCWGSQEDDEEVTHCCLPSGCPRYSDDPIFLADTSDAVKVVCNNERCTEGQWMHADCFQDWEEHILGYLRSCGRARSWSEKQRHQNLWTKKGYDLAFKVCDCKCGRGHLRYDLSYTSASKSDEERRQKKTKRRERLSSLGNANGFHNNGIGIGHDIRSPVRISRSSFSSTGSSWSGSSPPSSTGTTPGTPPGLYMPGSRKNSFDFVQDSGHATSGNMFKHRKNLEVFQALPHRFQNTYHIKTEDEGPHGNDEIRCLVLTSLSTVRATTVHCVVCLEEMQVYDKYPLIDGTFFLTPVRYTGVQEIHVSEQHHRMGGAKGGGGLYLNAVCMRCMDGRTNPMSCRACRTPWSGGALVLGTMYAYDLFGAVPCCAVRLSCNRCKQPLLDPTGAFKFFSDYSRLFRCPCCGTDDYHFVKPLEDVFNITRRDVRRL